MELGDKLRSLRKSKGLTQTEFAKRMNIPNQNVSNYERGFRQPDYETLKKFADYFDVTTDYLLGQSEISRPSSRVVVAGQEINLSIEEFEIFIELKKHPALFHDLATNPEAKVKELIKLSKMKKMFLEDDIDEGFGKLED